MRGYQVTFSDADGNVVHDIYVVNANEYDAMRDAQDLYSCVNCGASMPEWASVKLVKYAEV